MTGPRIVVAGDAPRELWAAERGGESVTASRAWEIARGTMKTWRRIASEQMNGSTFRGTAATRAGSAREAALLDEAADHLATCTPNSALWAAADNDLHRATPDGTGTDAEGRPVVVEVKSHEHGWKATSIPLDHMGQLQWQINVLGAHSGLYGFEVRDEDDMPPTDGATWIPVPRDDDMIEWLVSRANAYIAWREAGCPEFSLDADTPAEVRRANAQWVVRKRRLDKAVADEKPAADALRKAIAAHYPHAERFGATALGFLGGFQLIPSSTTSIDEAAWADADPTGHAAVEELRVKLALLEANALARFPKTTRRTPTLKFQEVEDV
ncbi:hypothetical protein J2X03_003815 [Microbacterium trichothecenolyticum]|uniref:hypothetical protein n=1 Tax=Microbacterium trichothecenolyticum TaxID=69370 RepID=UPI002857AE70|nr:hypothetical protein [Microbacterium trichothecenolyticum]MDR7113913.1 hypothetical protein [Microbacterium trichothecenolyticum]